MIVIAGPTASGKSALALDIALEFDGVIINADSMQVYAELSLLTARPSSQDEARAPHRLYGVLSASERCSAGRWQKMAVAEIEAAWARGKVPIVVGGTGLYLRALTDGISDMPDVPSEARAEATALLADLGGEAFLAALAGVDPLAAARIPATDPQRLIRAYEVWLATGRALSDWQKAQAPAPPLAAHFAILTIEPPREAVKASIDARFDQMMDGGALDEVSGLLALGLDPALPAMKAVGVPELARHLGGEIALDEATELAKQATRQYAKRQMTWLRNQISGTYTLSEQYSERFKEKIFPFIRTFLLTPRS